MPDRRAVRWYATTGLVDRPTGMRGRTALYGPRHLLQLVAVKRRQAEGRSLAQIQAELAGATDGTLAGIARVSDDLLAGGGAAPQPAPARTRFWAAPPVAVAAPIAAVPPGVAAPIAAAPAGVAAPEVAPLGEAAPADVSADVSADGATTTFAGVRLPGGVLLLLPAQPGPDELAAIRAAAAPLLDVLADRGLLTNP
nr:MerR family transcriptional regulator [Planosporangium thailandense]